MIPSLLLPRYFKWIGLVLLIAGYILGFSYTADLDDVQQPQGLFIQLAILIGALFIAGAKEKMEDEMIQHMRLTSLQWSVFLLIGLRVAYKCTAFYTKDAEWMPQWQVNSLLLFYLLLFYYQLYVREYLQQLFKRGSEK